MKISTCLPALVGALCLLASPQTGVCDKPNIILINLDDADRGLLSPETMLTRFPNLSQFATDGIQFTNAHVTTPLCGPSRACLMRAQYAHNTGIRVNNPMHPLSNGFGGGMRQYYESGFADDDLSVWMKNAGYRTMLVGKYLHPDFVPVVPPGWDDYFISHGNAYFSTGRFTNRTNPKGASETLADGVYRTTAETVDMVQLIYEHVEADPDQPFFLFLNPLAPHVPSPTTAPSSDEQYAIWWPFAVSPRGADFNEVQFSDKSSAISALPPLNNSRLDSVDTLYRDRLLTTRSVDDMFAALMETLRRLDLVDNTYLFLTSDNGFSLGHQRLFGKANSFNRSTNVPLYVIGPNITGPIAAAHLLAHIDIGPTLVELAGGQVPGFVDGQSFVPLLEAPEFYDERQWRTPVLIENWQSRNLNQRRFHFASTSMRLYDSAYTEWADGTPEYYVMTVDPLQLDNRYEELPSHYKDYLADYLKSLKQPMVEPIATISEPFEFNALVQPPYLLSGLAEDDRGVARVLLTIKDLETKEYWNGSQWQPARVRVDADLTRPQQQLTTWTYFPVPPPRRDRQQRIGLWVRPYDSAGHFDRTPAWSIYDLAIDLPSSTIDSPLEGSSVQSPVTISGHLADDRTMRQIRLVVKNLTEGNYWNGSQWTTQWSFVEPSRSGELGWQSVMTLPPGRYFTSIRVYDEFGNVQSPIEIRRFTVPLPAP